MTLGSRIRRRREERGLSQSELAALLGYNDRSSIAKIESGKSDLTQSKIVAFAEALHTTPEYLMGWTNDPYDYNTDEEGKLADIPPAQLAELSKQYEGNLTDVWHAWLDIQFGIDADDRNSRYVSIDDLCFALWGDDEEMDEDDLKVVLDYAEFVRQQKLKKKNQT